MRAGTDEAMPQQATPCAALSCGTARASGAAALAATLAGCAAHHVELPHRALFAPPPVTARTAAAPSHGAPPRFAAPQDAPHQEKPLRTGDEVNPWLPAVEIVSFQFLLNQFDRHFLPDPEDDAYESDWDSFTTNLERSWVLDDD